MASGKLPNLKRLTEGGVSGDLTSIHPPETPAAWPSFMTGKNPGKHGVFDFIVYDPETKTEHPVNAHRRTGKTIQDYLSAAGKTSLILNVPTTYPPSPTTGAVISGFLTPADAKDYAHPPELVGELEEKYGRYPLFFKSMSFVAGLSDYNCRAFMEELEWMDATKFEVAEDLFDRHDPDFTMIHIWGTDRLQHELWSFIDPDHPKYNAKMAAKWGDRIEAYYTMLDTRIGSLVEKAGSDAVTFIISDHGFGPTHFFIDLNSWLLREGFIVLKNTWRVRLKKILWKLGITPHNATRLVWPFLRYLSVLKAISPESTIRKSTGSLSIPGMLSLKSDVDWEKTRAYAPAGWSGIYVNTKGIRPNGSVDPDDYDSIRDDVVARWKQLRNPVTGDLVGGPVHINKEMFNGPFSPYGPDVMPLPLNEKHMPVCFFGFTSNEPVYQNITLFGNHQMEGILLANGAGIKMGDINGARLIDMAPTILHLLEHPAPDDMDGKVLTDLFDDELLAQRDVEHMAATGADDDGSEGLTPEEEEELRQKLMGLGYL
jgi:predicted AlkP superfamily phosphohydrolase/phosphomutase